MHSYALHLLLLIHIFPSIQITIATPAYIPTDFILLNCGDSKTSNDTSGRSWGGDERSRYAPPNADAVSSASTASFMDPSVFEVPYRTARVFHSPFTYTFPLVAGTKFLRLYFYPDTYSGFTTSHSFFSLTANAFTLLSNFSAFLHSGDSGKHSFMKEFVINVQGNHNSLDLTFFPNPDSFAFINGIEIVSMPDDLYYQGKYIKVDGTQLGFLETTTALENHYRLNVGGVEFREGGGGMFRAWSPDDDWIYFGDHGWTSYRENFQIKYTADTPPYSAPAIVYASARMTTNMSISLEWGFPVDSGFSYLLRLHFCEFLLEMTKQNQRVFTIKINNKTVEQEFDVIIFAGGPEIPKFMDYIAWVPHDGHRGKQDLRLSLFPEAETRPEYLSAFLNGLELFRLSNSNQSLASPNPEFIAESTMATAPPPRKKERTRGYSRTYAAATGGVISVLTVAAMSFLIFRQYRRRAESSVTSSKSWLFFSSAPPTSTNSLPCNRCRSFSVDEIKTATRNFDGDLIVGRGGFGNVYKGFINDGAATTTTVAVKRLNPLSKQGLREFLTEIEMLSKLRHHNLVSLIGYCNDCGEMILVYDYMANDTLREHLCNSENPPLKWKHRLQICLGAAKGLHYLHTGAEHAVIHRDVKTTNILLDEKWVAKMSDFGLSKWGPAGGADAHVSTAVKGSFGYVDPEYYRRRQLTEKSDVYSFGVVMLEVLCGRPAVDPSLPYEQANLAAWARLCYGEGTLEKIVDSNLDGQISPECFDGFAGTAAACVSDKGIERPGMSDVVWSLEFALQLQEMWVESSESGSAIN